MSETRYYEVNLADQNAADTLTKYATRHKTFFPKAELGLNINADGTKAIMKATSTNDTEEARLPVRGAVQIRHSVALAMVRVPGWYSDV